MFVDLCAFHFLLKFLLYSEQRTVVVNFLHHDNFRREIRTLLFGDSQKDQARNILLSKAVQTFIKNSRRFTEGTYPLPPPHPKKNQKTIFLSVIIYFFLYYKFLYTYYPPCALSDLCLYDTVENIT